MATRTIPAVSEFTCDGCEACIRTEISYGASRTLYPPDWAGIRQYVNDPQSDGREWLLCPECLGKAIAAACPGEPGNVLLFPASAVTSEHDLPDDYPTDLPEIETPDEPEF